MPRLSFRRNFVWSIVGSLVLALSQWAIVIGLAKLAGASMVGEWVLVVSIAAPVFVLSLLKLRQVQATDTTTEHSLGEYAVTRGFTTALAFSAVSVIAGIQFSGPTALALVLIAVSKAFESGSDLVYGHFQSVERLDIVGGSQLFRGIVSLVACLGAIFAGAPLVVVVLAYAASFGVGFVVDFALLLRYLRAHPSALGWTITGVARIIRQALPMGLSTAAGSLQVNAPRYFLEAYSSRVELGAFGALGQLMFLGGLTISAAANVATPRLARLAGVGDWKGFASILRRMVLGGAVMGGIAVGCSLAIGEFVLTFLFSAEFARYKFVLVWLSVASGLLWSYIFLSTALDALRRFHISPWIHLSGTAVIVVACFVLVPSHGSLGAAWAVLLGYLAEAMLFSIVVLPLLRSYTGKETAA